MNLKALWERYRAQRQVPTPALVLPIHVRPPKPFQPLTRNQSIAVLEDAIDWLMNEARATLAMPNGRSKQRRFAELRARDKAMARDYRRLARGQCG